MIAVSLTDMLDSKMNINGNNFSRVSTYSCINA